MSATSTSPAPFTSCAPSSTATAASSSTGKSARKWRKPTWKPSSNAPAKSYPGVTPRIISDNGPQFIAKDFKEFIRIAGMTHVRTSPYYPQSNGKIERWHKTLKGDCIRVQVPLSLDDARRIVADYVAHYNNVRLHSAIGYVTPKDKLHGHDEAIHAERDRKLAEARERRKQTAADPPRADRQRSRDSSRPAIDFAAVRAAITMAAGPAPARLPGHAPTTAASNAAPVRLHGSTSGTSRCFSRQPRPSTPSTASSAAAPATPWTCGPRPTACRIYDAAIDLCQRLNIPLPTCARRHREQRRGTRSHRIRAPVQCPRAPEESPSFTR